MHSPTKSLNPPSNHCNENNKFDVKKKKNYFNNCMLLIHCLHCSEMEMANTLLQT